MARVRRRTFALPERSRTSVEISDAPSSICTCATLRTRAGYTRRAGEGMGHGPQGDGPHSGRAAHAVRNGERKCALSAASASERDALKTRNRSTKLPRHAAPCQGMASTRCCEHHTAARCAGASLVARRAPTGSEQHSLPHPRTCMSAPPHAPAPLACARMRGCVRSHACVCMRGCCGAQLQEEKQIRHGRAQRAQAGDHARVRRQQPAAEVSGPPCDAHIPKCEKGGARVSAQIGRMWERTRERTWERTNRAHVGVSTKERTRERP
jgi:hypothetical protein